MPFHSFFFAASGVHPSLQPFPTRRSSDLLRAVRFATLLEFEIDPKTAAAIPPRLTVFKKVAMERSEEHTSELQSLRHLVCRLLLEKKNANTEYPVGTFLQLVPGEATAKQP